MTSRCGVIAIVGEPNAGKSTLINRLVGGKVSIVTPKEQTTRFNVRGVCAQGEAQMIFVDTPGIFAAGKKFEQAMVQAAWAGMGDADAVLLLIDAKRGLREGTMDIIREMEKRIKKPMFLALNKIDTIGKTELLRLAARLGLQDAFSEIFMISARKGDGVNDVKKTLTKHMPEGPWLYPEDQMSDIPVRMLAAEITREKLFMKLGQELPYALSVETEQWKEDKAIVRVSQIIYVQREGQKKIVIGKGGAVLKAIGTASRKELESMLGKKVHLELFVKVRAGWKDDPEHYRLLGLEFKP